MRKKYAGLLLLAVMLLCIFCGCNKEPVSETVETTEPSVQATTPPPGNPEDVTCKGSYTADPFDPEAVVASVGDRQLTNEQLQVWYTMAVAAYQQELHRDAAPDFSTDLATQSCPIDDTVGSWQQYFLKQALNAWHSAQALAVQAEEVPFSTEPAYKPSEKNHEIYMTGMPATEYLYGYHLLYEPNSMHQAYLDALPETLDALAQEKGFADLAELSDTIGVSEEALTEVAHQYNFSYMYFTQLSYGTEATEEQVQVALAKEAGNDSEKTVDIRHILLYPEGTN